MRNYTTASGLDREIDLYFRSDIENSVPGAEFFWPFSKKKDAKAELLETLESTDRASRNAFVVALQKKLEEWINASGSLSLARVALLKAKQFADLAAISSSPSRVSKNIGSALDAISSLKDIAIVGATIEAALSVPTLASSFFTIGSVAASAGQAATTSTRVVNALRTSYSVFQIVKTAKSPVDRAVHLRKAKSELDNVRMEALGELNKRDELEFEDDALEEEYEFESAFEDGSDLDEFEFEEDLDDEEFELESELNALEDDEVTQAFARQLEELSMRSFESELELELELENALDAMEDEFMVKRLRRKRKRRKRKGGLFKKILNTGAKIVGKVAGATPVGKLIKAGTSLVRGNVKGALGNLAKAALGTVLPPGVGTAATVALDALGGEEGEIGPRGRRRRLSPRQRRRRAIRRVARIARDTYREVADTLPENFDHPLVANEVARRAVTKAMLKNGVRPPGAGGRLARHARTIRLQPGERIVITNS